RGAPASCQAQRTVRRPDRRSAARVRRRGRRAAPASPPGCPAGLQDGRHLRRRVRGQDRSEEHTSELQSRFDHVCRLLLEKKKISCNSKLTVIRKIMSTASTIKRNSTNSIDK